MSKRREPSTSWAGSVAFYLALAALALFAKGCDDATRVGLEHAELFASDYHWTEPLAEPVWREAAEADHMRADDPVLGLYLDGRAWALPWWIMKNHHVANLILEGRPILLTFCEMCSTAAAFDPLHEGARRAFRLVGLYNGSILLSDRGSDSLWSPFNGECVYGPLLGAQLPRLPVYQTQWADWRGAFPGTRVLFGEESERGGHGSQNYPGQVAIDPAFLKTLVFELDERMSAGEIVLGVEVAGDAKAYPVAAVAAAGHVVNDVLGGVEVVAFGRSGTPLAIAFSRRLGQRVLTFTATEDGRILDRETGSTWSFTGEAVAGALVGEQLDYVSSGTEEWYIWAAYHPGTAIHR